MMSVLYTDNGVQICKKYHLHKFVDSEMYRG